MKTTVENIRTQLLEMAESRARWDLAELWNEFCEENNYPDDEIYNNDIEMMDEFFNSIADFFRAMGEYSEHDDFFAFDGYAVLNSFDRLTSPYSPVDFGLLAEWLADDEFRCRQYDIEIDDDGDDE